MLPTRAAVAAAEATAARREAILAKGQELAALVAAPVQLAEPAGFRAPKGAVTGAAEIVPLNPGFFALEKMRVAAAVKARDDKSRTKPRGDRA